MVSFAKFATIAVTFGLALAHPGEHHDHSAVKREVDYRNSLAAFGKRSLDACSGTKQARKLHERAIARRAQITQELRERRGIQTPAKKYSRDLATLEYYDAIDHNKTGIYQYSPDTDENIIFGANTSCILTPEVTDGPYYVTGEQIRKDVTEGQRGVPLYLEVQYLDVETCRGVPELYIDIWNANATGVYGGINETGNVADGGWDSTFLRGIQPTDDDGVVSFETIFPGHYEGRATHTHLLVHGNVTVNVNNTISDGAVRHIGQLFWNEELRSAVEDVWPYTTNTQDITSNSDDMWAPLQANGTYDPFPEYLYLGDDISDGLFAWIQVGINVTADMSDSDYYSEAAYIDADGGHQNSNQFM